jgi:cell division protein FtsI/penicillin-binding protein 2
MVMEEGTGAGFAWPCPVYGKTGTAESRYEDQDVNHCWGSGFCEVDGEKYVVTILIERGISGSVTALPLFQEICSYLTLRPLKTE